MKATDVELALTPKELKTLATRLDTIDDIELRAAIALSGGSTTPPDLNHTRPQPRSQPPYPLHLEAMLETLYNELGTVARDMCESRGVTYPGGRSCSAVAHWISDYRTSLATMPHGVELYDGLLKAIDDAARAVNQLDAERAISREMVDAANRSIITLSTVDSIARSLGDSAKGLNRERMRTLVKRGWLFSVSEDPDSGTKFYRLGDVLAAHRNCSKRRSKKTA